MAPPCERRSRQSSSNRSRTWLRSPGHVSRCFVPFRIPLGSPEPFRRGYLSGENMASIFVWNTFAIANANGRLGS